MEARYEIREQIGKGGLGTVYRSYDTRMGREVAIKRIPLHSPDPVLQAEATRQLMKEAGALASLHHPHIVTIYDVGSDEDGPYVVMELLTGSPLDELIDAAPLTWPDFRELVLQTQEALIGAHELNMIHSDIKPANLMLSWLPSGKFQVKIVDFGLATLAQNQSQEELEKMDSVFGSIFFMPPEQFERRLLDARSDLYSMGCVYYQALTGEHPYDGKNVEAVMQAHLNHQVRPLQNVRADIPLWACDWIMWQINRLPEHRPESARESLAVFFQNDKIPNPELSLGPVSSTTGEWRRRLVVPTTDPNPGMQRATASIPVQTSTSNFPTRATASAPQIQRVTTAITTIPHIDAQTPATSYEDYIPGEHQIPHPVGNPTNVMRPRPVPQAQYPMQVPAKQNSSNSTKIIIGSAVGVVAIIVVLFLLRKPTPATPAAVNVVEKPAEVKIPEAPKLIVVEPPKEPVKSISSPDITIPITDGKLPKPWQRIRLFKDDAPGSVIYDSGKITISGSGGLGGSCDGGEFVYQSLDGDGSIIARVNNLIPKRENAKVGIMIRQGTTFETRTSSLLLTDDMRIIELTRPDLKGIPTNTHLTDTLDLPNVWLCLERKGDQIIAKFSEDGITWTIASEETVEFPKKALVGLISTSGNATDTVSSTFSDVVVEP